MKLPNRIRAFLPPPDPSPTVDEVRAAMRGAADRLAVAVAEMYARVEMLTAGPVPPSAEPVALAIAAVDRAAKRILEAEQLWRSLCPGQPVPFDLAPVRAEVAKLLAVLNGSGTMPPTAG